MGAGSTNLFKDSSTCCFHESLTMLQREEGGGREESDSSAAFLRRERFDSFAGRREPRERPQWPLVLSSAD
jgi:hypothetical protein